MGFVRIMCLSVHTESVGGHDKSPKKVPPWHVDYLGLKTIKVQQTQKRFWGFFFTFPLPA